jgi:hypothetical protein
MQRIYRYPGFVATVEIESLPNIIADMVVTSGEVSW